MNKWLVLPVCLLAAVSCTVGPDYEQPQFFDDRRLADALETKGKQELPVSLRWYEQFGDERLNRLVLQVLTGSPNVQIAVSRLKQARRTLLIDETQFLPQLTADAGYTYEYPAATGEKRGKEEYYRSGLDASWEIDIWGGGRRLSEEASALARAAADNLADVMLSLTAETAENYINLRATQEQIRIVKRNLFLQREIYQTVSEKYDNGLTDEASLRQAAYAVNTTRAELPELYRQEEGFRNALAVLLGVLPGEIDGLGEDKKNLVGRNFSFDAENLYKIPLSAVRNRPDVRLAENNLIAKNAVIGQAVADLFPGVSISGMLGWQNKNVSSLVSSSAAAYGFAPAVSLTLFDFGRLQNRVKLAEEVKKEYVYVYQNTLLTAVEEIKNAAVAVRKSDERRQSLAAAVADMQNAFTAMRDKYREGLTEFGNLLTAEQDLLAAEKNLSGANASVYQSVIAFYKAVGGGY